MSIRKSYLSMLETEKSRGVIEQISKLSKRVSSLSEVKMSLVEYLLKVEMVFSTNAVKITNETRVFEETIAKKSFYSIGKIQPMKNLITVYKQFMIYVQNMAQVNISNIKKVDCNTQRSENTVVARSSEFCKSMESYMHEEEEYNKVFSTYSGNCEKLKSMMAKFKTYEDPIQFYNLHTTADFSKKLDKKYHLCENAETSLINKLRLLDQKRKNLSDSLKEIKEKHVFLLHSHMQNIESACKCMVDKSKDEFYNLSKSSKTMKSADGDIFKEDIERFDDKYGKIAVNEDELINDLKELFKGQSENIHISSDYKLFLDRCETFRDKKCESVEESLFLQKRMQEQIERQAANCEKIEKDYSGVEKQIFKSDGVLSLKTRINKYFGSDMLELSELSLMISESTKKRIEKIGKVFKSHSEKLRKIVYTKDQEIKNFKKRIDLILSEHDSARQNMVSPGKMSITSVNDFKSSVKKSFQNFKGVVEEFSRKQKEIDQSFLDSLIQMTGLIEKQASHSRLTHSLGKQKQKMKFNVLERLNIDNEIIMVVKKDAKYEVLFNDSLAPHLEYKFTSLMDKTTYEDTKKVLSKKEHQQRNMIGQRSVGCCGVSEFRKIPKGRALTEHQARLIDSGDYPRKGIIQILSRGLTFQEKSKNPFSAKIELMIPKKEILSFIKKTKAQNQAIEIQTAMGAITFLTDQSAEIEISLQKNLGSHPGNFQTQKRERNNSDTSSFNKNNNTSTEFKISYETGVGSKEVSKTKKNQADAVIIKELLQKWKTKKFLSQQFRPIKDLKHSGISRQDYTFEDDLSSFLLKQKKDGKASIGASNYLYLEYQWKVSFPDLPMLKSFRHKEEVRIELGANSVRIIVVEQHREEAYLVLRKKFYSEVQKMNKSLSDFVVEFCEREGDVIFQQEKVEEDSSLNIDGQNFMGSDEPPIHLSTKGSKAYSNKDVENSRSHT